MIWHVFGTRKVSLRGRLTSARPAAFHLLDDWSLATQSQAL